MNAFETFQKYYKERWNYKLVAKDWKEKGGKVIGYLDINCPEEIIMAAGCRPLLMTGDPDSDTEASHKHMEYPSSLPVRYLYEAILVGRYNFVDLICITEGDRMLSSTYGCLSEEKRLDPSLKFGELYFLGRLRTTFKHHRDFYLDRIAEFREFLEEFTGKEITNEALLEAFEITNETKRLLKRVSDLRKTEPPRISGCEALQIIMASMLMPKVEYNKLLKQFLEEEVNSLPKKGASKARIFVSGSPVDNLQLYELIESLPAIVVGEDTAFGDRYSDALIREDLEPMGALADRYTYKPADPWMFGIKDKVKYRVDSAVAAKAQAEVFFQLLGDDAPAWDYPDQKRELEKHSIPILLLESQEYKISAPERLRYRIETFLKSHEVVDKGVKIRQESLFVPNDCTTFKL
jgi:benzoyl-CoA reductase/2-hydroxyglutaryl-CoA dehydratase subunit BcrC/BadD/HgdB